MNENHDTLAQLGNEQFAYLTTAGRLTGKPHRIEIWFGIHDGRIYLMSGGRDRSDWVRNILANPKVTIEIAEEKMQGIATVLAEPSEADSTARLVLVQKYGEDRDLEQWGRESLAVSVDVID